MATKIDPKALAAARTEFARSGGLALLEQRGPGYFRRIAKNGNKKKRAKRLAVDKKKKK